jgi:hypothetical protein
MKFLKQRLSSSVQYAEAVVKKQSFDADS